MQSCHRQPSRVHAQPAGMLHGDPQWLRHWRQPRNGTSACGRSVDADHLHAQQVWRLWHCGERLLCAQRGNETHSVDRRIWVSVIQICKQNSNLPPFVWHKIFGAQVSCGWQTNFAFPWHLVGHRSVRDTSVCIHENLSVHWFAGIVYRMWCANVSRTMSGKLCGVCIR